MLASVSRGGIGTGAGHVLQVFHSLLPLRIEMHLVVSASTDIDRIAVRSFFRPFCPALQEIAFPSLQDLFIKKCLPVCTHLPLSPNSLPSNHIPSAQVYAPAQILFRGTLQRLSSRPDPFPAACCAPARILFPRRAICSTDSISAACCAPAHSGPVITISGSSVIFFQVYRKPVLPVFPQECRLCLSFTVNAVCHYTLSRSLYVKK